MVLLTLIYFLSCNWDEVEIWPPHHMIICVEMACTRSSDCTPQTIRTTRLIFSEHLCPTFCESHNTVYYCDIYRCIQVSMLSSIPIWFIFLFRNNTVSPRYIERWIWRGKFRCWIGGPIWAPDRCPKWSWNAQSRPTKGGRSPGVKQKNGWDVGWRSSFFFCFCSCYCMLCFCIFIVKNQS